MNIFLQTLTFKSLKSHFIELSEGDISSGRFAIKLKPRRIRGFNLNALPPQCSSASELHLHWRSLWKDTALVILNRCAG